MRTISYIFRGTPKNRSDCIDYSLKGVLPCKIDIVLHNAEDIIEQKIIRRLYATFIWIFEDKVASYEEELGGVIQEEDAARQATSVNNANMRLSRIIQIIKDRLTPVGTLEISGLDLQFEYDSVKYDV